MALAETAYLEITLNVPVADRPAAAAVYSKYKPPFLKTVKGALSKHLLVRDEDVQVLHGFDNVADAQAYLTSNLFKNDVGNLAEHNPPRTAWGGFKKPFRKFSSNNYSI